MVLFGPDGVLMVDSQNRQVAEKTLKAVRAFTDGPIRIMVNTHVHQRLYRGERVSRNRAR